MNPTQKKAMIFANTINNAIKVTEEVQERLNPFFEELKAAMDADKVKEMESAKYLEILSEFQDGTDEYKKIADSLSKIKAPARFMGVHHNLTSAYKAYAVACQDMVDSMGDDRVINVEAFNDSELRQEKESDSIAKYIQKIFQA